MQRDTWGKKGCTTLFSFGGRNTGQISTAPCELGCTVEFVVFFCGSALEENCPPAQIEGGGEEGFIALIYLRL